MAEIKLIKSINPNRAAKLLQIFSFILFFLIPFLGNNHLSIYYITIDRFWIETTFVLLLIIVVIFQYITRKEIGQIEFYRFLVFFIPFATANAISFIYTWNTFSTLSQINTLIWIIGSVYIFLHSKEKDMLLKALVLGTFLSALCAVVQAKVLFPNLIEVFEGGRNAEIVKGQAIPFSSFLYHNVFGGFMCFVLPLALYFGVFQRKWIYMAAASGIITGLILSTSRAAIGISFVTALFFIGFMVRERDTKSILTMLTVIIAGIAITFMLLQTGKKGEFKGLTAELGKKAQMTKSEIATLNTRTEIWKNSFSAFKAKPVIGYGAGAFEYGYRKYFDGGIYTKYAHSTLLKYGVELGIIGVFCFLFYIYGFIYFLYKSRKEPLFWSVMASTACGFLFGLLDFSFDMPVHVITFFALSSGVFIEEKNEYESDENFNLCYKKNPFSYLVPCIIIISLIGSFIFTTKTNMSRKSIENGVALEDNGFVFNACLSYKDAIYDMPTDNEGYIRMASCIKNLYEREGNHKKKEEIKNNLIAYLNLMEKKRDKDSELYFIIGMSYASFGETNKAEGYLLKGMLYYPSSPYHIYEIVVFYAKNNELQKAKAWSRAIDPYLNKYATSRNPKGFYVYKIRDIEAEIEYRQGNAAEALAIASNNLYNARERKFVISNIKSGENLSVEPFLNYLNDRVNFLESRDNR
ncbi:MAG: O-antigen ligase family protein [Proteobacteria bacterium]|nr:O-antigen ligase family protein [Pseudomonadota bacterium]